MRPLAPFEIFPPPLPGATPSRARVGRRVTRALPDLAIIAVALFAVGIVGSLPDVDGQVVLVCAAAAALTPGLVALSMVLIGWMDRRRAPRPRDPVADALIREYDRILDQLPVHAERRDDA